MATDAYFTDMRNLAWPTGKLGGCPVSGCAARLEKVDHQWGEMPYCPVHCIRIHHRRTFVYYNGSDKIAKRNAALRNILFDRDYFKEHILGNAAKAETHRICHETSEDALTWNVFSQLARGGLLAPLLSTLTHVSLKDNLNCICGALKSASTIRLPSIVSCPRKRSWHLRKRHCEVLTKPDIMVYVPGQALVLVEAKFTFRQHYRFGQRSP